MASSSVALSGWLFEVASFWSLPNMSMTSLETVLVFVLEIEVITLAKNQLQQATFRILFSSRTITLLTSGAELSMLLLIRVMVTFVLRALPTVMFGTRVLVRQKSLKEHLVSTIMLQRPLVGLAPPSLTRMVRLLDFTRVLGLTRRRILSSMKLRLSLTSSLGF